jgi:SAM-dependent methyltransferase
MGIVGGSLAYAFLKHFYPGGQGVPLASSDAETVRGGGKLTRDFGPGIFEELRDKVVLDFGCGTGDSAIELARNGVRRVVGLDIQEHHHETARRHARDAGVDDRCVFATSWNEPVDVVISQDAFEHFSAPERILTIMRGLVKDTGYVLVNFGPPWLHPYGGHLFSVFPWAHLVFTEPALLRWRADFKNDGATRFEDVAGGLNQMTLARWERIVAQSGFRLQTYQTVPIRAAAKLYGSLTREYLTAMVSARLAPAS